MGNLLNNFYGISAPELTSPRAGDNQCLCLIYSHSQLGELVQGKHVQKYRRDGDPTEVTVTKKWKNGNTLSVAQPKQLRSVKIKSPKHQGLAKAHQGLYGRKLLKSIA